jgi:electron transport complex protein RnfE
MTSQTDMKTRFRAGLWTVNPGLVQLLGICPLLAVTTTLVNGLGLGIATLFVLTFSNMMVSATRHFIRPEIRIPMFVLIIASLVTCIELLFYAWFPGLGRTLGIFLPLIVTNCAIVARAEVYASKNPVGASIIDGFAMGAGFALLLCALGAFRELIGYGTLFSGFDMLFGGEPSPGIVLVDGGFLLAILPPGAFIALAFAIAAKNAIDKRRRVPHKGSTGARVNAP